jgi:signal transduction histidine kinase
LSLSRYQVPSHIKLVNAVTQNIVCRLPDARLRQALLNLIINAQQAMDKEDGEITISAEHVDQQLTISVCDQGPGFPESMLQADILAFNSMRDGGTGLGLSMVQRFVRNQGGRLILKNRQPRGACVTLQLNCIETEHA